MKKNIGSCDRVIRFVMGGLIIAWGWKAQSLWGLIGVVLVLTAACEYCPPYKWFGINTKCGKKCGDGKCDKGQCGEDTCCKK